MTREHIPNRCPVNHSICGHRCFMRHHCETKPDQVTALLERLDPLTWVAIGRVLAGKRRPQIKHLGT